MDFAPLFQRKIHPRIETAARYCLDIAAGHDLPRRADFRPSRVRSLLGYMFLIDILPNDYHFSLFGEHMILLYNTDPTNTHLSDLPDAILRDRLRQTYDTVTTIRSFQYLRGRFAWTDRSVDIERLLVPMTDENGNLNTIFGVTIPHAPREALPVYTGIGAAHLEIDEQITGQPGV